MLTSDDWGSYAREVPKDKHLTGKIFTQRIERNNLTLRTRIKRLARKTICFSRSVELHEKVIGAFIEKHVLLIGVITWSGGNLRSVKTVLYGISTELLAKRCSEMRISMPLADYWKTLAKGIAPAIATLTYSQ